MSFSIFTDSSANVDNEAIDQYGLRVFPLTFMDQNGSECYSYIDGRKADLTDFYMRMRNGEVFKTSLPHLSIVEEMLRADLERGLDVLYLGFSSALSGTYQSVDAIMKQLSDEFPDRVLISVDTLAAAGGQGLLVVKAAKMAKRGAAIEEVAEWVEQTKLNSAHWFTVDDLVYLFRGGRVSKSSAWAGNLLNIKPVLHVNDNGELVPKEKVRGRKKSLNALVDHMKRHVSFCDGKTLVFINHGDCLEDAEYVAQRITKEIGPARITIDMLDPVIGAHTGPGLIALFFMGEDRS